MLCFVCNFFGFFFVLFCSGIMNMQVSLECHIILIFGRVLTVYCGNLHIDVINILFMKAVQTCLHASMAHKVGKLLLIIILLCGQGKFKESARLECEIIQFLSFYRDAFIWCRKNVVNREKWDYWETAALLFIIKTVDSMRCYFSCSPFTILKFCIYKRLHE